MQARRPDAADRDVRRLAWNPVNAYRCRAALEIRRHGNDDSGARREQDARGLLAHRHIRDVVDTKPDAVQRDAAPGDGTKRLNRDDMWAAGHSSRQGPKLLTVQSR